MSNETESEKFARLQREVEQAIVDAFGAIRLYRNHWASGTDFQTRFEDLLMVLRGKAKSVELQGGYHIAKLLRYFTDSLELSNKTGEYISMVGAYELAKAAGK